MKKRSIIICLAAISALVASCGNKHQFTLNGTLEGDALDGQTIYLLNGNSRADIVDSAVVSGSTFSFSGTVQQPWVATLMGGGFAQQCVVEPGTIEVSPLRVAGTPLNDKLQAFVEQNNDEELEAELAGYLQLYYSAPDAAARAQAETWYDSVEAILRSHIVERAWDLYHNNEHNILAAYAVDLIATAGEPTLAWMDSLMQVADPLVAAYKPVATKHEQLRRIDATSAGKHYTDITGVNGKLSDLVDGHLALVDFYASWCGPCRAEIRDNLVPLYAKYKGRGLVVVGLNVWERGNREQREAAHAKVMADLGITYPQLVDSTRTATDTYGVSGIPQIMLIGPDGTILARDLRGAAIEEAIVKALAQ